MKGIKKPIQKLIIALIAISLSFGFTAFPTFAASSISNSKTDSALFAVPEGGWASINIEVIYREGYTSSGSTNTFNSRTRTITYSSIGATTLPYASTGYVSHSNGTSFTSWTRETFMYDGSKWNGGNSYKNTTSVSYSKSTSTTGSLGYTMNCTGSIIPTVSGTVSLSLKTK